MIIKDIIVKKLEIIEHISLNNLLVCLLYKSIYFLIKKYEHIRIKKNPINVGDILMNYYKLKIKGVLHIGAHIGEEYECYYRHKISNIIFFEPLPHIFKDLKKKLDGKAILINLALGNDNTLINMYVDQANMGASSSILKPKLHLEILPEITFNEIVEVNMVKLDDFSKLNRDLKIEEDYNLIVIDVQGYELEVFKGARDTLRNIDYIFAEINKDELYEGCVLVDELDDFLREFGFKRAKTIWEGLSGNAIYIKMAKNC